MSTVTSQPSAAGIPYLPVAPRTSERPRITPLDQLPPLDEVVLLPIKSCNLCGSSDRDLFLSASHWTSRVEGQQSYDVVMCRRCGLLYLASTLPKEVLEYPGKHGGSLLYGMPLDKADCRKYFRKQLDKANRVAQWLESRVGPMQGRRTLDILSGTGGMVQALIDRGAHAEGLEPSAQLAGYGTAEHGLRLHQELLENFQPESAYDLITGLQMLNHYVDPTAVLQKIKSLLSPNGYLCLELLNFPHALRRKPLKACVHVDHPVMFTVDTLTAYLQKVGFEIKALETDQQREFDFGSFNHMHVVAQVSERPRLYCPSPTAALDAKLACLASLAQYSANLIDAHAQPGRHFIRESNIVKRSLRRITSLLRRR